MKSGLGPYNTDGCQVRTLPCHTNENEITNCAVAYVNRNKVEWNEGCLSKTDLDLDLKGAEDLDL